MIGLLTAVPRTPLYDRLKRENRLFPDAFTSDNSKLQTNVIPKGMTYAEMVSGYRKLHYRLFSNRGIAARARNKTRYFTQPASQVEYSPRQALHILGRFLRRGLLSGGISRVFHFLRSIPFNKPSLTSLVTTDWIMALSMRDYMDRQFVTEFRDDTRRVGLYVEKIRKAFGHRRHKGTLRVSFNEFRNAAAAVSISMRGWLERDSFGSVARHVENLLINTRASVTLHIEGFHKPQLEQMRHLLKRLSRYADRIHIRMDEKSRFIIDVDSSVFNLALQSD
jgi:hypothetical protein